MVEAPVRAVDEAIGNLNPAQGRKVYMGSYMPFAGVKYYALLDEGDIAEGRNRIGAVGWHPEVEPSRESRELVAA